MKGIKGFQKGHCHSQETKNKISQSLSKKIEFKCDFCSTLCKSKPSEYKKKKKHFCSMKCYVSYKKLNYKVEDYTGYKGVRKSGESKQVYHRRYCERHPDLIAHLKARRYARKKGAEGSHTLQEWNDLKSSYDNCCCACGNMTTLTKDHIIPLVKGGSDYIENIQPLCKSCNCKKNTKIVNYKTNDICENPELVNYKW